MSLDIFQFAFLLLMPSKKTNNFLSRSPRESQDEERGEVERKLQRQKYG